MFAVTRMDRGFVAALCWLSAALLVGAHTPRAHTKQAKALQTHPRIIVRFSELNSEPVTREQATKLEKLRGVRHVKALTKVGMAVIQCHSQDDIYQLTDEIMLDPQVELVVPDSVVMAYGSLERDSANQRDSLMYADNLTDGDDDNVTVPVATPAPTSPRRLPNDPLFPRLWGLDYSVGGDINAPEAWQKFVGDESSQIIVGIIDSGIDYKHEDLQGQMWVNPGEIPGNGIDDDGNGYIDDVHGANFVADNGDPMDDQGHGSHCSGTVAAVGDNAVGIAGIAWRGVKLMGLKFLDADGSGRTSDAIAALDYAVAHGARITSNSWGGGASNSALRVAMERAAEAGVLFIAAAGNDGSNNDIDPQFPANYQVKNVIVVASTASGGQMSSFSNYGNSTVHVAAPGSQILSLKSGGGYKMLSGTSMATPLVSGLAALIWMYRPELTAAQVKEILVGSVSKLPQLEGRIITGGLIDAEKALDVAALATPEVEYPPEYPPQSVSFTDGNNAKDTISGMLLVEGADDETNIESYQVYIVSSAGYPVEVVATFFANGSSVYSQFIPPMIIPPYGHALVAVSVNSTGILAPWSGGVGVSIDIADRVEPLFGPAAAKWLGDVDTNAGAITGRLRVTRAADEEYASEYRVRWRNSSQPTSELPLLGTIPAVGYARPVCSGDCYLVEKEELVDGFKFSRHNYSDWEEATMYFNGPAKVTVTEFNTEAQFDFLSIGSKSFSGQLRIPMEIDVPEGRSRIHWWSDWSVVPEGGGWSFEITGVGVDPHVDLVIKTNHVLGDQVEVTVANTDVVRKSGIVVDIKDFIEQQKSRSPQLRGFVQQNVADTTVDDVEMGEVVAVSRERQFKTTARDISKVSSGEPKTLPSHQTWLQRMGASKEATTTLELPSRSSRVMGKMIIRGWVGLSREVNDPAVQSVGRALATAFEDPKQSWLTVNILRSQTPDFSEESTNVADEPLEVSFEVLPGAQSMAMAGKLMDGVEARLLMLTDESSASSKFKKIVNFELASLGVNLPVAFDCDFENVALWR